jgi:hypothetical protein
MIFVGSGHQETPMKNVTEVNQQTKESRDSNQVEVGDRVFRLQRKNGQLHVCESSITEIVFDIKIDPEGPCQDLRDSIDGPIFFIILDKVRKFEAIGTLNLKSYILISLIDLEYIKWYHVLEPLSLSHYNIIRSKLYLSPRQNQRLNINL